MWVCRSWCITAKIELAAPRICYSFQHWIIFKLTDEGRQHTAFCKEFAFKCWLLDSKIAHISIVISFQALELFPCLENLGVWTMAVWSEKCSRLVRTRTRDAGLLLPWPAARATSASHLVPVLWKLKAVIVSNGCESAPVGSEVLEWDNPGWYQFSALLLFLVNPLPRIEMDAFPWQLYIEADSSSMLRFLGMSQRH